MPVFLASSCSGQRAEPGTPEEECPSCIYARRAWWADAVDASRPHTSWQRPTEVESSAQASDKEQGDVLVICVVMIENDRERQD